MPTFPDYYGNAWAVRREIYESINGILDVCIAAGCDTGFNYATFENPEDWNHWSYYPYYKKQMKSWTKNARRYLGGKSGIVRGDILHFYHEHYFDYEYYLSCFAMGGFDVERDLYRDKNGLLWLKNRRLRNIFE